MVKRLAIVTILVIGMAFFVACGDASSGERTEKSGETIGLIVQGGSAGATVAGELDDDYKVEKVDDPAEIENKLAAGSFDAAITTSIMAAKAYEDEGQEIMVVSPVSLGGVYVLGNGLEGGSFKPRNLARETLVFCGKDSYEELVTKKVMQDAGVSYQSMKIEYVDSQDDLEKVAGEFGSIVVARQPYAAKIKKISGESELLDLNEYYEKENGTELVSEVMVISKKFAQERPDDLKALLKDYEEALDKVSKSKAHLVFYGSSNRGAELLKGFYGSVGDFSFKKGYYYEID